ELLQRLPVVPEGVGVGSTSNTQPPRGEGGLFELDINGSSSGVSKGGNVKRTFDPTGVMITTGWGETLTWDDAVTRCSYTTRGKMACHSPFRADSGPACFMAVLPSGRAFLHDPSMKETWWPQRNPEDEGKRE